MANSTFLKMVDMKISTSIVSQNNVHTYIYIQIYTHINCSTGGGFGVCGS